LQQLAGKLNLKVCAVVNSVFLHLGRSITALSMFTVAAKKLGMPLVHDAPHNIWALGVATATGRALASAKAFFPSSLIDAMGRAFDFNSLRGRRIIMVAWASW